MNIETPHPPQRAPNPIAALPVISCGFPSPAEEFSEPQPSLDSIAILRPAATFLWRAGGDSMLGAGIWPGDVLVVDRSVIAVHESIVIAVVDGQFTCKKLLIEGMSVRLSACNRRHKDIVLSRADELVVWGVVTSSLHWHHRNLRNWKS